MILMAAGVSGSGRTTIGALLAGRLRWRFADAGTFHQEAAGRPPGARRFPVSHSRP